MDDRTPTSTRKFIFCFWKFWVFAGSSMLFIYKAVSPSEETARTDFDLPEITRFVADLDWFVERMDQTLTIFAALTTGFSLDMASRPAVL
jgi:hypothetical protein